MFDKKNLKEALRLYAVTDNAWLGERTLAECVAEALAGGATFVQLRDKQADEAALRAEAAELLALCRAAGVPFVVNDDVETALAVGADGVHVGQEDMACERARVLLGPDAIIGVSTQTVEQALAAEAAGADYLGVGGVRGTATKPEAGVLAPEEFRAIAAAVDIPVVAIGGIDVETVPLLADLDVVGAAVVSAIFAADDIENATRELSRIIDETLPA
ncbi:thiamine phosphate synthase [uncultured Adlercreutzia sp.]|uniref:thiamine phosphate synthase n=1 Tax=uncultured Adlercreutzia sp. TaxID=875803 RepID=UPI0025D84A5B|nr:thiamine phosphate synthase [uncultured Adlercreutzia sp.]MCI9261938.1 thiamine phosphate synthase [Eggerthellaceae bacterium]